MDYFDARTVMIALSIVAAAANIIALIAILFARRAIDSAISSLRSRRASSFERSQS